MCEREIEKFRTMMMTYQGGLSCFWCDYQERGWKLSCSMLFVERTKNRPNCTKNINGVYLITCGARLHISLVYLPLLLCPPPRLPLLSIVSCRAPRCDQTKGCMYIAGVGGELQICHVVGSRADQFVIVVDRAQIRGLNLAAQGQDVTHNMQPLKQGD